MKSFIYFLILMISFTSFSCSELSEPGNKKEKKLPKVFFVYPTNNQEVGLTNVYIGSAENSTKVYLKINDGIFSPVFLSNNFWATNIVLSDYGYYTNSVYALNDENEYSLTNTVIIKRTTIPSICIVSPSYGSVVTQSNITIYGTASIEGNFSITKVQISLNKGNWIDASGTISWSNSYTLTEGSYTFDVRVIANSGKTNSISDYPISFSIPPTVQFISPIQNITIMSNHYFVSVSAQDNVALEGIYLSINNSSFKKVSSTGSFISNFLFNWESENSIKTYSKDSFGFLSITNEKKLTIKNSVTNIPILASGEVSIDGEGHIMVFPIFHAFYKLALFSWSGSNFIRNFSSSYFYPSFPPNYFGYSVTISSNGKSILVCDPRATFASCYQGGIQKFIYSTSWQASWAVDGRIFGGDAEWGLGFDIATSQDGSIFIASAKGYKDHVPGQVRIAFDNTGSTVNNFFLDTLDENKPPFAKVAISPEGTFSCCNLGGKIYIFQNNSGIWVIKQISVFSYGYHSEIAMSQNGGFIYIAMFDGVKVLKKSSTNWILAMTLNTDLSGFSGRNLALSYDNKTLAVADPYFQNSGAIVIFNKIGTNWIKNQTIYKPNAITGDVFGQSLALNADGSILLANCTNALANKTSFWAFNIK
ncbi:MAG: hypothetical protein A2Y33_09700 [Spirochaetes bacterium GWF1_51_8]|nr:MAG: hypothetical protein A2Y33_09700 [Spirochaetes bacterium GWF1_51_8]